MAEIQIKDGSENVYPVVSFDAEALTGSTSISAFGASQIWRCGKTVTVTLSNAKSLSVGNNTVFTLPAGWRPRWNVIETFDAPTAPIDRFRITIYNDGRIDVYNYSSSAISADTNATVSLTFAAAF